MRKLGPLLALYFAQGLPFGFQATALPLLLRERGVPLQAIGFASLLAAPWMAKPLWAPLVDRYGSVRFGRRKSWIVPMQVGLIGCALAAARAPSEVALAAIILVMNLFAATQDIAVDALAVSWLEPHELGPGNAVQVVGYKLGMLTGGGLLVWQSARIGWDGLFYAMAGLLALVLALSVLVFGLVGGFAGFSQSEAASTDSPLHFSHVTMTPRDANGMRVLLINGIIDNQSGTTQVVRPIRADFLAGEQLTASIVINPPADVIYGGQSRGFSTRVQYAGGKMPEVRLSFMP